MSDHEKLLSANQVSKYLTDKYGAPAAISVSHLRWLVTMGGGPDRVTIGRRVGYKPSALDAWHLKRTTEVKAKPAQEQK